MLLLLPRSHLGNPAMIRADVVASSHEDDSGHDGRDVDALHDAHQKFSPECAAGQKKYATEEPAQPGKNTDSPRASFNEQVMYLRVVSDDDERRARQPINFICTCRVGLILREEGRGLTATPYPKQQPKSPCPPHQRRPHTSSDGIKPALAAAIIAGKALQRLQVFDQVTLLLPGQP